MLFGMKHFKMNILTESGGGAGGSADPGAAGGDPNPGSNGGAALPGTAPEVYTPPEWAKGMEIDPEILKAPMFSSVKDIKDVVKGYYHAQKMVGADKLVVPTKNSSPEEWRNYYIKGGLPEKFDDYKVEMPKSFEDQAFNTELLQAAHENNIRPDQLKTLLDKIDQGNEKLIADFDAQKVEEKKALVKELQTEWGAGFEKQIARANRVVKHFGGDELHQKIANSEIGNDKDFLRLMAKIGEKMTGEDSFQYEATATFAMTKDEARSKMNAMYGDLNGPYLNRDHAQHQEFVDKMLKYQEILSK